MPVIKIVRYTDRVFPGGNFAIARHPEKRWIFSVGVDVESAIAKFRADYPDLQVENYQVEEFALTSN